VFGDFVYKDSIGPFNHTGTLYSPSSSRVADVNTDRGNHALQLDTPLSDFKYGARRLKAYKTTGLTSAKQTALRARISYFNAFDTEYDGAHNNQKGKLFTPWLEDDYWEFDCVGFNERIYEDIGLNPTSNEGVYITPDEQRNSSNMTSF